MIAAGRLMAPHSPFGRAAGDLSGAPRDECRNAVERRRRRLVYPLNRGLGLIVAVCGVVSAVGVFSGVRALM